ncbi:CG5062 [Drosophila busckii]|uniref:Cilia- and flagella-associated protein 45 n=1 Tax=Drosophila busckii TaxID=30019 RepID=A0A0M3QYU7_DROBS|nr:trichohyalin [Drosophila busckii]ALC48303.1 CG5062 [Drosophila busckii]
MPMSMPCTTHASRALPRDCYDKLGRRIGLDLEQSIYPSKSKQLLPAASTGGPMRRQSRQKICEKMMAEAETQNRSRFLQAGKTRKAQMRKGLPPGTVPPGESQGSVFSRPKASKRGGCGGVASYFHVQGRSWESKGFAELKQTEVEHLRSLRPPTVEQLQAEQELRREEERQNKAEAERVRMYYQEIDEARRERELEAQRQIDAEADDTQDEVKAAEIRRLKVLHQSLQARHEQDERVQSATRAIGAAKCSAMWTAQIEERAMLERLQDEFDVLQEHKANEFNDSKWGSIARQNEKEHERRLKFGAEVRQQINDRRQLRHLAAERDRDEALQVRDAFDEYRRYQQEESKVHGARKAHYRNELFHYIQLHRDFGKLMCEQERRDELRANDYVIKKEAQKVEARLKQAALEAEKERKRDAMFVIQQKILDAKDNREEMRLLAEHERLERKYRMEEREAVETRRRLVDELRQGNLQAMQQMEKMKACYYAQRKRETDEMKAERLRYEAQQKIEQEQNMGKKINLHQGVTAQMEEHERARRREIEQERLDDEKARAQEAQRQKEIDMVISVKLDELAKKQCLPYNALQSLSGRVANSGQRRLAGNIQP